MLRITVELVPFGQEEHKRIIAQARICNDGTGNSITGNYDAEFMTLNSNTGECTSFTSKVKKYDRAQNVWNLILAALSSRRDKK